MEWIYEIAKAIGAASGFCAAMFLVWDRCTKHFPIAIIVARPLIEGSAQIVPVLFLKNVSDRPILVSWENGASGFRVAKDQTTEGIVRTLLVGTTTISLGPGAHVYLPLMSPRAQDAIDPDNMIDLNMKWKFAQPLLWRVERQLKPGIKKRDLDALIEGYLQPRG